MPKIEYKIVRPTFESGLNDHTLLEFLNLMGKREWVLAVSSEDGTLIFQRPIAINDKIRQHQLKEGEDHDTSGSREATKGI